MMLDLFFMCMCVSWFDFFFFFKQKTAYEMRISDWSSDVCSSDLRSARCPCPVVQRIPIPMHRGGVQIVEFAQAVQLLCAHHINRAQKQLCLVDDFALDGLQKIPGIQLEAQECIRQPYAAVGKVHGHRYAGGRSQHGGLAGLADVEWVIIVVGTSVSKRVNFG